MIRTEPEGAWCPHLQQRSLRFHQATDETAESRGFLLAVRARGRPLLQIWTSWPLLPSRQGGSRVSRRDFPAVLIEPLSWRRFRVTKRGGNEKRGAACAVPLGLPWLRGLPWPRSLVVLRPCRAGSEACVACDAWSGSGGASVSSLESSTLSGPGGG